jgi:hypothetical protein
MYTDACMNTENEINFLEHVQSKVSVKVKYRGNLQIFLTSPMGTNSTLLGRRVEDDSSDGFNNWPFMTVHNWGESPRGMWTLEIVDVENNGLLLIYEMRLDEEDLFFFLFSYFSQLVLSFFWYSNQSVSSILHDNSFKNRSC